MSYVKIKVNCPHCSSPKVVKNGQKSTGKQNFLCKDCRKQFQHDYTYQGAAPVVKKQIISSLIHGCGIRDSATLFKTSQKTVLNLIERVGTKLKIEPSQKHYTQIQIDEFYSFVGSKEKKVWIFYAYAPETREILAFTMGRRNIEQLRFLMLKIKHLKIKIDYYRTDAFEGFKTLLSDYQHLIGKEYTKAIEGRNTCIRARIARFQRRSTKFSKKLFYQWWLFTIFVFSLNYRVSYIL
jgi:insertion element IS1 protein InsB